MGTWRGLGRDVVVSGTTIASSLGPVPSWSTETTTAGRRPACSRPRGRLARAARPEKAVAPLVARRSPAVVHPVRVRDDRRRAGRVASPLRDEDEPRLRPLAQALHPPGATRGRAQRARLDDRSSCSRATRGVAPRPSGRLRRASGDTERSAWRAAPSGRPPTSLTGTGLLRGVSGSVTLQGLDDFATLRFTETITGRLCLD